MAQHPFERVLLVTEHTEFDAGAERLAFDIVRACGIGLKAVFPVVRNMEYEVVSPALAERTARELSQKVESLKEVARTNGVSLDLVVAPCDEAHVAIVGEARNYGADLIVARRRGRRSFLSNFLIGEMVSKVAAEAPCSMLFVPRHAHLWSQAILAALDMPGDAQGVASLAARVATACGLPLTLLHVTGQEAPAAGVALAQVAVRVARVGALVDHVVVAGKPADMILEVAKMKQADLVVVGRHRGGKLLKLPFGATTRKVIGNAEVPVLVVKGDGMS